MFFRQDRINSESAFTHLKQRILCVSVGGRDIDHEEGARVEHPGLMADEAYDHVAGIVLWLVNNLQ